MTTIIVDVAHENIEDVRRAFEACPKLKSLVLTREDRDVIFNQEDIESLASIYQG